MHVKQSVEYLLHRKYEANGSCYCYARLGGRLGLLLGWCNLLPYTESKKISLPESRAGRREGGQSPKMAGAAPDLLFWLDREQIPLCLIF